MYLLVILVKLNYDFKNLEIIISCHTRKPVKSRFLRKQNICFYPKKVKSV